ncbi:MAG: enhancer of mRNA decapping [Pycnora praestabilis]|nr:MAG: enhancer of mRNA decapping [Pycnora praestabilis]
MAAEFIGVTVLVTLKSPPSTQLQGLVANIINQQLLLRNVYFPASKHRILEYRLDGSQIADLEVAPTPDLSTSTDYADDTAHRPQPLSPYEQLYSPQTQQQPSCVPIAPVPLQNAQIRQQIVQTPSMHANQTSQPHVDPAILSFGKKPSVPMTGTMSRESSKTQAPSAKQEPHQEAVKIRPPLVAPSMPSNKAIIEYVSETVSPITKSVGSRKGSTATATLTAPFHDLNINADTDGLDETDAPIKSAAPNRKESVPSGRMQAQPLEKPVKMDYTGKRSRRGGRGKAQKTAALKTPPVELEPADDQDSSPMVPRKKAVSHGSKGWRQSSLTEEPEAMKKGIPIVTLGKINRQAVTSSKRKAPRKFAVNGENHDGWATEDAHDIQGMGEFDFQGNLSKFDKRSVFDQIRTEDTTADEDRLVSINRLPQARPGTAGGKNLHHTENVLDRRKTNGVTDWNSEAGDSEVDELENGDFGSGRSSRRAISRTSTMRAPSRKGSAIVISSQLPATSSSHLMSTLNRGQHSSSHATSSPKPSKLSPPDTAASSKPSLRLMPLNRPCPTVSPLQMIDVEHIADSELGLTEDMMTENAARGVAEVALLALSPGGKRLAKENHNALPVVVVLAGNNKSGARAIAAGRHLRNHGVRVMICVLGIEREEELLENVRRQLSIFRNTGGKLGRWEEMSAQLKTLDAPPELIIDGLLGMHVSFEDLRSDDQATAYEIIGWANRSKASVLAVDIPTGVDASTGEITIIDGEPLNVRAKFVVSMGAPKAGLLHAMAAGEGIHWQLFVADIGISNMAWRKYGTRRRHVVDFASQWVVGLRYQGGVE